MAFAWSLRNVHYLEEGSESIFNALASATRPWAQRHPRGQNSIDRARADLLRKFCEKFLRKLCGNSSLRCQQWRPTDVRLALTSGAKADIG